MSVENFPEPWQKKLADLATAYRVEIEELTVTENGTYSEEGKAYSPVTVNVSGGGTEYDIKCYIATAQSTIEETTDCMLLFDSSTMTPSSEPVNKAKGGDMLVTESEIIDTFLCESFPPDTQTNISIPNSGYGVIMPNAKLAVIVSGEIQ